MFGNWFLLKLTGEQSKTNDISRLFQLISLNSWVFNFASHDRDLSFGDFQAELLSFETLIDAQTKLVIDQHYAFSTNQKAKAPMFTRKLKLQTPLKSQLHQSSYGQKKNNSTPPNQPANDRWSICQIFDKKGHDALDYYHRFDFFFRDGFHLLILLQWLLKSTILRTNMSGIRTVEQMLISLPMQEI